MIYMNEFDIMDAKRAVMQRPGMAKAVRFLEQLKDEVNAHSDGWAYWQAPCKAAQKLQALVQKYRRAPGDVTEAEFRAALVPIKAFYTRHGYAAGMMFPTSV